MEKKRIKIAQLGIGHNHASAKMQSLRKLPELFEVVGVGKMMTPGVTNVAH